VSAQKDAALAAAQAALADAQASSAAAAAAAAAAAREAGPGRRCSPRHRMTSDSMDEGSNSLR